MELNLNRVDYIQVDATCSKAARLLPASEHKACQKVVVGSQSGVLHCFGISRGQVETIFKTLPGKSVSRVELGGAVGSIQDKIFMAAGNEVCGYTRKGKQFLKFDTNITDTIRCMASATPVWELEGSSGEGSVTCLGNYDMTGDGIKDLLVGRNDGQIEVYAYNDVDEPVLRFSYNCGESVTSVLGGVVSTAKYDEVIVTTFSGWVFGLSSEHAEKRLDPNYLLISPESAQKILKLKEEVEQLEAKVVKERENYQLATYSDKGAVSAVPFFGIEDSFVLNRRDASYTLSIQVQTAIDTILLQCNVPVDLLDSDKNSAVVSYTPCDSQESGNYLLATFRCQANTSRLEVKLRTIEGQAGVLRAYVSPVLQPKCCQLREYQLKPLSLHCRTHTPHEDKPLNVLTLRGTFSVGEMHSWVVLSLPEVPERAPATDPATLYFVSTFLGTVLDCVYTRGEATFKSDNISTISILKDVLTKEATRKKISLDISCGMITDLFIDVYKFRGNNVKSKVPALLQILDHYDFKSLADFFTNKV
ncbi:conserved hypothetical protein [Ixodes scapularis]|uniref:Bardet-Biedl syndrome 7 protein homolog n=1 Tax=Ixodes scapularis TaxID=6945 RepID=B7Q560_IXOSC|nr:conserved hypothetical protein [Ixodes scapularis]|eukprot:XP_002411690.1 conserved hypothetical protein [Ixodes scapularis]